MNTRAFGAAVALIVCACTSSMQRGAAVEGVSLGAVPSAARDSIVLTLHNGSTQGVGYNLCPTTVERQTAGAWQPLASDRVCTMELRTLNPGEQATFTTTLPAGAAAGEYRFVTKVAIPLNGELRSVASNTLPVGS